MLQYRLLPYKLAICRLGAAAAVPDRCLSGALYFVARTAEELSIVCEESLAPAETQNEPGWAALMLQGPFPFTMAGVLASFIQPLATAGIPIFAMSTFDTDYVLIKRKDLEFAIEALGKAGHEIVKTGSSAC